MDRFHFILLLVIPFYNSNNLFDYTFQYAECITLNYIAGLLQLSSTTLANTFKWFIQIKKNPAFTFGYSESLLVSEHIILCGWEVIIYNDYNAVIVNCKIFFFIIK